MRTLGATWTTPAIITGNVEDQIGQPLSGASVIAIPARGGLAMRAMTDRDGGFVLEGLSPGTYRVDVSLAGFAGWRQNHVQVGEGSMQVRAVLSIRPLCECITAGFPAGPRTIPGQVVDEADRPLPHARVEFVGPRGREQAHVGDDGRFLVSPPAEGTWSVVASDSGFASVTQRISRATPAPLVFRLRFVGTRGLPDIEGFNRGCACPEYLGPGR